MGAAPRPVVTKPFDADQLRAHFLFRGVGHEDRILIVRHHHRGAVAWRVEGHHDRQEIEILARLGKEFHAPSM
jgi:hypothetical protein